MDPSRRPTLPPLHTLNLPRPSRFNELYESNDPFLWDTQLPPITPTAVSQTTTLPPLWFGPRTNTDASPSTSPTTPITTTNLPSPLQNKIRLVPTSFEEANAVVLVTPLPPPSASPHQALLFVGPALARLRRSQRQLPKGARIHPYRIASPLDRRPLTGLSNTNA